MLGVLNIKDFQDDYVETLRFKDIKNTSCRSLVPHKSAIKKKRKLTMSTSVVKDSSSSNNFGKVACILDANAQSKLKKNKNTIYMETCSKI